MRDAGLDIAPGRGDALPVNARLAASQVRGQPMNQIRMEVGVANHVQEEAMLDGIERFADVDRNRRSPKRRFLFVEACCNSSDSREESSGCRVAGTEPMLRRRRRERRREEGDSRTLEAGHKREMGR